MLTPTPSKRKAAEAAAQSIERPARAIEQTRTHLRH